MLLDGLFLSIEVIQMNFGFTAVHSSGHELTLIWLSHNVEFTNSNNYPGASISCQISFLEWATDFMRITLKGFGLLKSWKLS